MMNFILRLIITAAVAFGLTKFLSGVHLDDFKSALYFAIVLGLLNTFVRPIFKIIGFPITIITFGLFSFVINAVVVLMAAHFISGMKIDGFWWALLFSIILSTVSSLIGSLFIGE